MNKGRDATAKANVVSHLVWLAMLSLLPTTAVGQESSQQPAGSSSLAEATQTDRRHDRPLNVIQILVDDLGIADLGCYGSEFHETPHVDQFARTSVRFTQAYASAPVCSPTRAAILTGKHPARLKMTIWHEGAVRGASREHLLQDAASRPDLPLDEVTLAELARDSGYATVHLGKWHLGRASHYPENQGFDLNIGGTFWGAPSTFFYPFRGPFGASDPIPRYVPGLGLGEPGDYLTDRLTDHALQLLPQLSHRPFVMHLWYYSVHSPIEAPTSRIEAFRKKPPGPFQKSPEYAAMLAQLDDNLGRLLDAVERAQLQDRTVIIITSDNGGVDIPVRSITPTNNFPFRSGKGTLYEGGIRVPLMIRWPGISRGGTTCSVPVVSHDLFVTLCDGLKLPYENIAHLDGVSLLPLLDHPDAHPDTTLSRNKLFWHYPHYYPRMTPSSAIRKGDWKLIHRYEDQTYELFNLAQDVGEQHNLASDQPERVEELRRDLDAWRDRVHANVPRPW